MSVCFDVVQSRPQLLSLSPFSLPTGCRLRLDLGFRSSPLVSSVKHVEKFVLFSKFPSVCSSRFSELVIPMYVDEVLYSNDPYG